MIIGILPILLIITAYLIIREGKVLEAMLVVIGLSAIACGIFGASELGSHDPDKRLIGAILICVGLISLLATVVTTKILFKKEKKS